ncbi:MAG TPA: putative LPS assembly protein LptD [Candidatus Cloacimonadota bacterium]|nr:putative LPS assembly protein LptD [Candidatus Cloacimonadota bacterium]
MKKSGIGKKTVFVLVVLSLLWCVCLHTQQSLSVLDENSADSLNFPGTDSLDFSALTDSITAADSLEVDSVFYAGDSVFYSVTGKNIILAGNANVIYHTSNIKSDTISIDMKKEQAYAKGQSFMEDGDQLILGDNVYFDLDTQWGLLERGASKFDKGYYYGDEIRKVDKKAFDVDNGIFTTCDALHPHFHIGGKKLRVYQDDKVVGKPIIFYVNHLPIMALPFGTFTIKRGRQSGILVPSPGWNDTNGKYLENIAYYFAYKDYADVTLGLDYYEKTGWQAGVSSNYIKRYVFKGDFSAILQKKITSPQQATYEWNIKSKHHHELGNNTTFDADLNFVSSSQVWEGSDDPNERLAEEVTSSIAYKRPFLGSYLNIGGNYKHDLLGEDKTYIIGGDTLEYHIEKKTITLPSVTFYLQSKPFYELFLSDDEEIPDEAWWKQFSYSYNFKAIQTGSTSDPNATLEEIIWNNRTDDTGAVINEHHAGAKHTGSISYNYKLKGWLTLKQAVSGNETWFDRDKNDNKFVRSFDYNTSSTASFSLYGMRDFGRFYFRAIRHIITPAATFYYQPDYTDNSKYYSFGGISTKSSKKQRKITLSVDNKWSLKLLGKQDAQDRKINDFFTINSNISYDFENDDKGFSDIKHTVKLNPNSLSLAFLTLSTSPNGSVTQGTYDLKFKDWNDKKWDYGVSNWTFSVTNKLDLSGDARYIDYFPVQENKFETSDFFTDDSLDTEEERIATTIKDVDALQKSQKNWSLTFTHTYNTNKTSYESHDYTSTLRMALSAKISQNWTITYDNYIDLKSDEVVSHNFTITRELHCWQAFFRYTKQGDYWNYRFQLFNIKLPDALKFRTSDHSS